MTRPTTAEEIFTQLKAPFPSKDIEWKMGGTSKDGTRGRALPYLKFQAVADRLDQVLGELNWTNTYVSGPAGGVVCRLSLRIGNEWLCKENGAGNTDREGVKGGLSDAFKRAGTMFGIGRYLHAYEAILVDVDEHGRWTAPALPDAFLPADEVEQRRRDYEAYEAEVAAGRLKADSAQAADAPASIDTAVATTMATQEAEVKAEPAKATRTRSGAKATAEPVQPPAAEATESTSKEVSVDAPASTDTTAGTTPPAVTESSCVTVEVLPVEQLTEATAAAPDATADSTPALEVLSAPATAAESAAFILDANGYPLVPEGLPEADIKLLGSLVARVAKAEQLDPVRDYLENGKGRTALTEPARKFLFAYVAREEAIRKERAAAAA